MLSIVAMVKTLSWNRRHALLTAPGDQLVRLWTYQSPVVLEVSQERGYLCGDREHTYDEDDPHWMLCYEYMRDQMAERIPDFSGDLPVWAWAKRHNERERSTKRGARGRGREEIRITFVVPRSRLLFSDYDLWHIPLNRGSIFETPAEDELHDGDPFDTTTWGHIFDLRPRSGDLRKWMGEPNLVQVCVDRIYLHEIESIRHFESNKK